MDCTFWKLSFNKISGEDTVRSLESKIGMVIEKWNSQFVETEDYGYFALYQREGKLEMEGVFCFLGSSLPEWFKEIEYSGEFDAEPLDPIKDEKDRSFLESAWTSIDRGE